MNVGLKSSIRPAAIVAMVLCWVIVPAGASIIPVTNTNDSGPGSLRQALAIANDGDTIDATGVSGAITLTSGTLLVNKSMTINGAGADILAVDGNAAGRVFFITSGETVAISGFTVRNGHAGNAGGGIDNENNATLSITNCTISGNVAGLGGGTFNNGMLSSTTTTISDNFSSNGGAVSNSGGGILTITNSTVSGNSASSGGGIFNIAAFAITNSTFSGNSAQLGGGISST